MKEKNLKICVYTICKNEEQFVNRWVDSMQEADAIYVLDTGSTDHTVEILKQRNVNVETKVITPWRFDVARNLSLDMVPSDTDICVCTDLDEVFEPGWRKKLEEAWDENTKHARYNYNWSFDDKGDPAVNFYIEKIHSRNEYRWTHPVHEVLRYFGTTKENFITIDSITLNHYPDHSKSRSSYLPLLELSVAEDPEDDRNMHYLGREYMYYGKWNECIDTLIRHLHLKSATWKDERCASMRFIARSYQSLERFDEAKMWLEKAIEEAPYLRDPYVERAILAYHLKEFDDVITYGKQALQIQTHAKTYINEPFSWDSTVYDILSIAYYYQGDLKNAIKYVNFALDMNPQDERLLQNKQLMEKED